MNAQQPFHWHFKTVSAALKRLHLTLTSLVILAATLASCAAEGPFNPDNLGPEQFARVSDVCHTVMGLNAKEPLSGGQWLGNNRLDYFTSHYRGCITSLSDSLQIVKAAQVKIQADADCRAEGYLSDSAGLASCVLQKIRGSSVPTVSNSGIALTPTEDRLTAAPGSFFYASGREVRQRAENACAALGMEPTKDIFNRCVKGLIDTFFAIDNPVI